MRLYGFFQSSAAFRVRIALNLKSLEYEQTSVNLIKGEHHSEDFARLNPQQAVPTLVDGDRVLTQSLAILEYLEEKFPKPPLLPATPDDRARVRALAQLVACDIHPLNNRRVLVYLKNQLGLSKEQRDVWCQHWIAEGLKPLEKALSGSRQTGSFCYGDTPTMADVCLVPQIFNAKRSEVELTPYPTLLRIFSNCMRVEAFDRAQPSKQPDSDK
jgi:maleylacetoacetate isomerase